MTYVYTVEVIFRASVEVTADSPDVAQELTQQHLNLEPDDNRVSFPSTDGVEVVEITSDDKEAFKGYYNWLETHG